MHVVRDGQRELEFEGTLLATSSSRRAGNSRWVEFALYRTVGGLYVLSRIGKSTCYHRADCKVVERNRIEMQTQESLGPDATPCWDCNPDAFADMVAPEQPRYWAQVSETAGGVVSSLYKYDDNDTRYLTNVAKRLLEDAARHDLDLGRIFLRERVQ